MMPSRSPSRTSKETSRTAVRPPNRFVTRSSVSTRAPDADAGELIADARGLEPERDPVVERRHPQGQVDPRRVAEAERPEAGPERDRDALRARGEGAPAARNDQEHLRERDGGEREVRPAQ